MFDDFDFIQSDDYANDSFADFLFYSSMAERDDDYADYNSMIASMYIDF